jgi:hypothetical protein
LKQWRGHVAAALRESADNGGTKVWNGALAFRGRCEWDQMEATMPVILWLLGVPLVVVIALMLTHVI